MYNMNIVSAILAQTDLNRQLGQDMADQSARSDLKLTLFVIAIVFVFAAIVWKFMLSDLRSDRQQRTRRALGANQGLEDNSGKIRIPSPSSRFKCPALTVTQKWTRLGSVPRTAKPTLV
jgi:hypothetical protein